MDIAISDVGTVKVVTLSGKMNVTTAGEFVAQLPAILAGRPQALLIDMSGVEYISSAGLRAIIECSKLCRAGSTELAFCQVRQAVLNVLELSGLTKKLALYADAAAALAGLEHTAG